jgi:hypothetical protein
MKSRDACASYALKIGWDVWNLRAFQKVASSLVATSDRGAKAWRPRPPGSRKQVALKANHPLKATAGGGLAAD